MVTALPMFTLEEDRDGCVALGIVSRVTVLLMLVLVSVVPLRLPVALIATLLEPSALWGTLTVADIAWVLLL